MVWITRVSAGNLEVIDTPPTLPLSLRGFYLLGFVLLFFPFVSGPPCISLAWSSVTSVTSIWIVPTVFPPAMCFGLFHCGWFFCPTCPGLVFSVAGCIPIWMFGVAFDNPQMSILYYIIIIYLLRRLCTADCTD